MTTDSANSEREIVYQVCDVIRASHGHDCLRCERECSTPYGPGVHGCWLLAEQAIAKARKSESAELTSLRSSLSRKDEVTLICPKDGTACCDDLCHGSGCVQMEGYEMLEICDHCGGQIDHSIPECSTCTCDVDDDYEESHA